MKHGLRFALVVAGVAIIATPFAAQAQTYKTKVIASGLVRPTGLALFGKKTLYLTEVPTPGVPMGMNSVDQVSTKDGMLTPLVMGNPQPTNIAVDSAGNQYWTCKSAGVILKRSASDGTVTHVLDGLTSPSGIAVDSAGNIYFTEIPEPGTKGGTNVVAELSGGTQTVLEMGDPAPTEITVAPNGDLYWTCNSAGVILKRSAATGQVTLLMGGLEHPTGITIDRKGKHLYYTEVPTPGVSGAKGGTNKVSEINLKTMQATTVHMGDPEPTSIVVAKNGVLYWTCSSAGVIVKAIPKP